MGSTSSKQLCQIESDIDRMRRIRFNENPKKTESLRRFLLAAVDECIAEHCEFGEGFYVNDREMEDALLAYMKSVGWLGVCWRWLYGTKQLIFDHFAQELFTSNKVRKSGNMLVGIRIKSWPAEKAKEEELSKRYVLRDKGYQYQPKTDSRVGFATSEHITSHIRPHYNIAYMSITFKSVSPIGYVSKSSVPIGRHAKLQNWTLVDADEVVVPFNRMFVYFGDKTHEDGMVSLKKPASFTISASDGKMITRRDVVDQIKNIVDTIHSNPSVFMMHDWVDMDYIFLFNVCMTNQGHWEAFIHGNWSTSEAPYKGILTWDEASAVEKQSVAGVNHAFPTKTYECSHDD